METELKKETQTIDEAINKVVNWWADKSFNTPLNQNNGDDSSAGGFGFLLMNMASMNAQKEATPEKIELFKTKLAELLKADTYYLRNLSVDYHGDMPLVEACEFAGLSTNSLPIKSSTWVDLYNGTNVVTSALGYYGKRIEL